MKMLANRKGNVSLEEVSSPQLSNGCVLVETLYSCISVGTEKSGLNGTGKSLIARAIEKPDQVKKVFKQVADRGILGTLNIVKSKLDSSFPIGYSLVGKVIGVPEDLKDFKLGDIVACAGAQAAFHAEIVSVPRNLTVKIPTDLNPIHASTVTLGAIAIQGVRRFSPTIGETVVVVGLGILGQITAQILKACGCVVVAVDMDGGRVEKAIQNGADFGFVSNYSTEVDVITSGYGADGVIITASSTAASVLSDAFKSCRKKGRVVLVGDVPMDINRDDIYLKELDFLISTSYGPGRYDIKYEEGGQDYPIGYVRWTENRNFSEYLRLLKNKSVNIENLVDAVVPLSKAEILYKEILEKKCNPVVAVIDYTEDQKNNDVSTIIQTRLPRPLNNEKLSIGIVGTGGYATNTLLPIIKNNSKVRLHGVCARTGLNANNIKKQYSAEIETTNISDLLTPDIDVLVIATRHDKHASEAEIALLAGKDVFIEKPIALNFQELNLVIAAQAKSGSRILTGFNRRHSPHAVVVHQMLENRAGPVFMNYTMNAGYIDYSHWVHTNEGGGRNIGEACHIYDLFQYFTSSKVVDFTVNSIGQSSKYKSIDNFTVSVRMDDGSVCNLNYLSNGSKCYPKERAEINWDGNTVVIDNFLKTSIYRPKGESILLETKKIEKGNKECFDSFIQQLISDSWSAEDFACQCRTSELSFEIDKWI